LAKASHRRGQDTLPVSTSLADPVVMDVSPDKSELLVLNTFDVFSQEVLLGSIEVLLERVCCSSTLSSRGPQSGSLHPLEISTVAHLSEVSPEA
jgi:hypothetical protein